MNKITHGVLLTGGSGTRLAPFNSYVSKHLLNVAGKPIIDYPIQTLKQMGITDLTVVLGSNHSGQLVNYIGDGSQYGLNINYCFQREPKGISQAVNLTKRYVTDKPFITILGDNLFCSPIKWQENDAYRAQIVLDVNKENDLDILRFGVATVDCYDDFNLLSIEEKPKSINTKLANYPITGIYQFDAQYFEYFNETVSSGRGEWEVTDIIRKYCKNKQLGIGWHIGFWSDMGEIGSIDKANNYLFTKNR